MTHQICDRDSLCAALAVGQRVRFLFFWSHASRAVAVGPHVPSPWAPTPFELDGFRYPTAEHDMMAGKARLFGDTAIHARILAAAAPGKAKALGRAIASFDQDIWARSRFDIVVRGAIAKFSQDARLRDYLLRTGHKVLAEASPRDAIRGIGLAADHPDAGRPDAWPGVNFLGFALMEARTRLARA